METLFLLAGFEIPIVVVRKQLASAINFIVQLGRDKEGKRIITEITELCGMEGSTILIQTLAMNENGVLQFNGLAPRVFETLHQKGGLPYHFFEKMS
jgi:pilus assembly protein CpaF